MNIRYINLSVDNLSTFDANFCNIFNYNCRFISNWMSRNVRKLKIPTDGTYNFISLEITNRDIHSCLCSEKALFIPIHWTNADLENYLLLKDEGKRVLFYVELMRQGFKNAAKVKDVNLNKLNSLLDTFVEQGCRNEWQFKSIKLEKYGILLKFKCLFHTYDFELVLTVCDLKKNKLSEEIVFKIYPDEIFFSKDIRSIVIEGYTLYINDFLNRHFMSFDLNLLKNGIIKGLIINNQIKKYMYDENIDIYHKLQWL